MGAVDGILQLQAGADAAYFAAACGRPVEAAERDAVETAFLKAYRWQYILSGAGHPHFADVLSEMLTEAQTGRIAAALGTLQ